jgi:hypothetical protein
MEADQMFLDLGVQYYLAARSSVLAQQTVVAGNLFHHAIENMLKAHLSSSRSLQQVKKEFGHRLIKAWTTFKAEVQDASELTQFDHTIRQLEAFEDIRYPDGIVRDGAIIIVGAGGIVSPATPRTYSIVVEEIDRLVPAIFKASSRNPKFFTTRFNDYARAALTTNNPVAQDILDD